MKLRIIIRCSPVTGFQPFCRTGHLLRDVSNLLSSVRCWVAGHNGELVFEAKRLSMRCTRCGWQSPGWTIEGRGRQVVTHIGERRRHPRHRVPAAAVASSR